MIPKTGPISIYDFKKTHGCYIPGGNPEFGGSSSPNAQFELSNIYTKNMIPIWHEAYVGNQQDMDDMRGCPAGLNRVNWSTWEDYNYPGRTRAFYGNRSGMTSMNMDIVSDGSAGASFGDPWGTNIQHRLQGKATSGDSDGLNSAVITNFHFYMDTAETLILKFRKRFTFSGTGPSNDPAPPPAGERQGQFVVAVEYGDIWAGSNSNVVFTKKISISPGSPSDQFLNIPFSASRPYKLISLQTNNHGHPSTDRNDLFRGYFGNFYLSVGSKP